MKNPELQARQEQLNLAAANCVPVREFPLAFAFGGVDRALYISEELVGAIEAMTEPTLFRSFERQTQKYSEYLPAEFAWPEGARVRQRPVALGYADG